MSTDYATYVPATYWARLAFTYRAISVLVTVYLPGRPIRLSIQAGKVGVASEESCNILAHAS